VGTYLGIDQECTSDSLLEILQEKERRNIAREKKRYITKKKRKEISQR